MRLPQTVNEAIREGWLRAWEAASWGSAMATIIGIFVCGFILGCVMTWSLFAQTPASWGQETPPPSATATPTVPLSDPTEFGLPADAVEQPEKRTRNAVHFQRPGQIGGTAVISAGPLHYESSPGQWRRKRPALRAVGTDDLSDDNDVVVRLTNTSKRIEITDREGNGVAFPLPSRAVKVNDTTFTATVGAVSLTYHLTQSGVKAEVTVPAKLGARTWTLDYTLLGTATASVDGTGVLRIGPLALPRPFAVGANNLIYAVAGPWELRSGSRVRVALDDTGLPAEALPYVLDPTTFEIGATGDDGVAESSFGTYPPSSCSNIYSATDVGGDGTQDVWTYRGKYSGNYAVGNMFLKWDTSSIPDTDVITSATLRVRATLIQNGDSRNFDCEYYDWGASVDSADCTIAAISSPIGSKALSTVTDDADNDITVSDTSGISKTASTLMRCSISGGQPNGENRLAIAAYEDSTLLPARLVLDYAAPTSTPTVTPTATDSPVVTNTPTNTPTRTPTPTPPTSGCCDCEGRNTNNCAQPMLVANTPTCPTPPEGGAPCTYVPNAVCVPNS